MDHTVLDPAHYHRIPQKAPPIHIDTSFSFADSILQSIIDQPRFEHLDLIPTDSLSEEDLKLAYDLFYGTSPLSSPAPSPSCSRSASPPPLQPPPAREHMQSTFCQPLHPALAHTPAVSQPPLPSPTTSALKSPNQSSMPPKQPNATKGNSDTCKNKKKSHIKHCIKRKEARDNEPPAIPTARPTAALKHVRPSKKIKTNYSIDDMPIASTGFVALPDHGGGVCGLKELLRRGFRLIKNDGKQSRPIVDENGLVIAIVVSMPDKDEDWPQVIQSAYSKLEASAPHCIFPKASQRGKFPALNTGISFGGGHKHAGNVYQHPTNSPEIERLLSSPNFIRISGFASGAFATWAPKLYSHYTGHFEELLASDPSLRRNFTNSVWAAVAFNFGLCMVTSKHRDSANLPYGLCTITALGNYNPTKGGHIVLWELKAVIKFPPGSTVLLPSAAISHSNTPIGRNEKRASFMQYSAGGLSRWVEKGFQKNSNFTDGLSAEQKSEIAIENKARCKSALSLFLTLDEL